MVLKRSVRMRIERFKCFFQTNPHDPVCMIKSASLAKWRLPHINTIQLRREFALPSQAAADPKFRQSLLGTLQAFGMGKRGHTVSEDFHCQVKRAARKLDSLSEMRIECVPDEIIECVTNELWKCISSLELTTAAEARLVFGTKAVHHLIPDLVPPMDRKFICIRFFEKHFSSRAMEKQTFREVFPELIRIARDLAPQLEPFVSASSFNTSIPKTLDNAIIGYVQCVEENGRYKLRN